MPPEVYKRSSQHKSLTHKLLTVVENTQHLFELYIYCLGINKIYTTYLYWTYYLFWEYLVHKESNFETIIKIHSM